MSQPPPPPPPPVAPTLEEWRVMNSDERERLLVQINELLSDPRSAMSEGRPHSAAKAQILDVLGLHFRSTRRVVYLAADMAVLYPAQAIFAPDILVVLDVVQPANDPRLAWVVADEGKGLDLVLEVLHHGDRKKDLEDNVKRYASLGIVEYFVYDLGRQQLQGHRLAHPGAALYEPVLSQAGRLTSKVLGVDLAVVSGTLRFFIGESELAGTPDLLGRLQGMVDEQVAKATQSATLAEQALQVARDGIFAVLAARGMACPEDVRAQIVACDDPVTLQRWLQRATNANTAADVVEG
jgi:Uma2 family endonuclease